MLTVSHISRFTVASAFIFWLSACSTVQVEDPTSLESLSGELSLNAPARKSQKDLQKESEAVRRFLMSELLLGEEQSSAALSNLEVSKSLLQEPDFQIQLNLAKLYLSEADARSALKALAGFDANPELLKLKAGLLIATGKQEEAIAAYQALNSLQKNDTEALLFLAFDDYKKMQYQPARQKLEYLISLGSNNLPAIKLLARVCLSQKDYQNAFQQASSYRSLDYSDEDSLKIYIISAFNTARFNELSAELTKESKIRPASPLLKLMHSSELKPTNSEESNRILQEIERQLSASESFYGLRREGARLHLLKQNFPEAITDLQLLLIENPKDSEARYSLALALSSAGKLKAAIDQLDQIRRRDTWYVKSQSFLALLYKQTGDLESARTAFEKALDKEPENDNLKTALAAVLAELGDFEKAKELYESELEKNPNNQSLLFAYGVLLFEMNNQQMSMQLMQRIIQINPQHAEALNFLAYSLAEQGIELERAESLAERALQIDPENAFFIDTRGWIFFKQGKFSESLEDLQRALKLSNMDPEIAEHLGDVYVRLGRNAEARQSYTAAIDRLVDSSLEKDLKSVIRLKEKVSKLPSK